jgi:trigger factor
MKVTVKHLPKSRVALTIEIPAERMSEFFEAAFRAASQEVEIQGFRKGKAPKSLLRERVGIDRITSMTLEKAIPRTYHEAVLAEKLIPVAEPTVHVDRLAEDEPLVYQAEVDILPTVEPGRYERVRVNKKKFRPKTVDPKEITATLERLQRSAAEPKTVDREAKLGDLVEVTYAGTVKGVSQDGLSSKNHPIVLGEAMVLPEFEHELVGLKAGSEKRFAVNIPRGEDKATEPVEFTLKMERVAELILPPLDDALAKKVGKQTLAEVQSELEAQFLKDREDQARSELERAVIDAVMKQVRLELPEALIEREITHRLELLEEQLRQGGQTLEVYLRRQKKSLDEFRKEIRPSAEAAVKTSLVLREISQREEIKAGGEKDTAEAVFKKTVDWLVENATK